MTAYQLACSALETVARPKALKMRVKDDVTKETVTFALESAPASRADKDVLTAARDGVTGKVSGKIGLGKEATEYETVIGDDAESLYRTLRGIPEPTTEPASNRGASIKERNGAPVNAS